MILVLYSPHDGIWSIRLGEQLCGLQLRAPRYHATYSERNGYVKILINVRGWRVIFLSARHPGVYGAVLKSRRR